MPSRRAAGAAAARQPPRSVRVRVAREDVQNAIASNPLFNDQFLGVLRDSMARQGEDVLVRKGPPVEPRCAQQGGLACGSGPQNGGARAWLGAPARPSALRAAQLLCARACPRVLFPLLSHPLAACPAASSLVSSRRQSATEEVLTTALGQSKATLQQLVAWREQVDRQILAQQKQIDRMEFALNKW